MLEYGGIPLSKSFHEIKGGFYNSQRIYEVIPTELYKNLQSDITIMKSLVFKLASGLEVFEKAKLVHFDLKPENILVKVNQESSAIEELKIIDFGSSFVFGAQGNLPSCTPVFFFFIQDIRMFIINN